MLSRTHWRWGDIITNVKHLADPTAAAVSAIAHRASKEKVKYVSRATPAFESEVTSNNPQQT